MPRAARYLLSKTCSVVRPLGRFEGFVRASLMLPDGEQPFHKGEHAFDETDVQPRDPCRVLARHLPSR